MKKQIFPVVLLLALFVIPFHSAEALTKGSLIFQGASGLTENNAKLFWDNTNFRLGIGTKTPTKTLDVNGNAQIYNSAGASNLTIRNGSAQGSTRLFEVRDGVNDWSQNIVFVGSDYSLNISTLANQTNARLNITTQNTNTTFGGSNGQFSITSRNRSTTLNSWNLTGFVSPNGVTNGAFGYQNTDINNNSSDFVVGTKGVDGLKERLRVTSTGNIGIGTTSPSYKLDINGSLHAATATIDSIYGNFYGNFLGDVLFNQQSGPQKKIGLKLRESLSVLDYNPTNIDIGDGEPHLLGDIYSSYAEFESAFNGFPESDKVFPNSGTEAFKTGTGWKKATLAWAVMWKAIHSNPEGSKIYIPSATVKYIIRPQILTKKNITIEGDGVGSWLAALPGGWPMNDNASQRGLISAESAAFGAGMKYGDGVTIKNLKISSILTAEFGPGPYTAEQLAPVPKNIYTGSNKDFTVENVWFEDGPECVWQGGNIADNLRHKYLHNTFKNCWALQVTVQDAIVSDNHFFWDRKIDSSTGVAATGRNIVIDSNTFDNPDLTAVYVGDNADVDAIVSNNKVYIEASGYTGAQRKACFFHTEGASLSEFKNNSCTLVTDQNTGANSANGLYAYYTGETHIIGNSFEFRTKEVPFQAYSAVDKLDVKEDLFSNGDIVYLNYLHPSLGGLSETQAYYVVNKGGYYASSNYKASIQLSLTPGGTPVDITAGVLGSVRKNTTSKSDGIVIQPIKVSGDPLLTAVIEGNTLKWQNHTPTVIQKGITLSNTTGSYGSIVSKGNSVFGLNGNSYAFHYPTDVQNKIVSTNDYADSAYFLIGKEYWSSSVSKLTVFGSTATTTAFVKSGLKIDGKVSLSMLDNSSLGYYVCIDTVTNELATSTAACGASSLKFKENIEKLSYGIEELLKFNPVFFQYKPSYIASRQRQIGFIAEEINSIVPELVSKNDKGEIQGLDYPKFSAIVVKAIQDLWVKFEPITKWFEGNNMHIQGNVCVDDTCVTKEQFKSLLLQSGVGATQFSNQAISESMSMSASTTEATASTTVSSTGSQTSTSTPQLIQESSVSETTQPIESTTVSQNGNTQAVPSQ